MSYPPAGTAPKASKERAPAGKRRERRSAGKMAITARDEMSPTMAQIRAAMGGSLMGDLGSKRLLGRSAIISAAMGGSLMGDLGSKVKRIKVQYCDRIKVQY
jgi:hypothetical protein